MASPNLSLKLTLYNKGNKVLFAEAGKNVVDFLFSIFSLSVGTVIRLLKKQEMVGALGNLCQSIEDLNDIYMQPDQTKDTLLMPRIATPAAEVPLLLLNVESTEKALYRCSVNRQIGCGSYVSDDPSVACGQCGSRMNTPAAYLKNPNKVASSTEGGFVKGAVAYMIMDDLVVKPMSTMSIVTIVSKFNVKDVSALEEKEVTLSMDEGLKLLKASLSTKNVLTDVFLACHNNESGSSVFGEKPAFGGFGSATQTIPFGSTIQQSWPEFGSSVFGSSSPLGASSRSAFGAMSTPGFGTTSTPAFGGFGSATQTTPFGSTTQQSRPEFGSSVFGSSSPFGASSHAPFGATSIPGFGTTSTPAFGAASTPATSTPAFGSTVSAFSVSNSPMFGSGGAFGASSSPAFGASRTPAFEASSTPAFGASSTPSFSFGSSPAFGQSASAFGSSPFGTATAPFGAWSSPFGTQATSSALGSSTFVESAGGTPLVGSRVAPYTPTTETDIANCWPPAGELESISAMPVYEDKSHEELRWEDYHVGDKGGLLPASQPAAGVGFGAPA